MDKLTGAEIFKRLEVIGGERDRWLRPMTAAKLGRLRARESRRTAWLPGLGWIYPEASA